MEHRKADMLDSDYFLNSKKYDFVYAWGSVHHTGKMYEAIRNIIGLVKKNGYIMISVYNKTKIFIKILVVR